VHNDVRAEGKEHATTTQQRLKFENVLMVVPLLFLVHTCIASWTDYGKVAKIAGGHKMVFINTPEVSLTQHFSKSVSCPSSASLQIVSWTGF